MGAEYLEERLIGQDGDLWVHYDLSMLPPGDYEVHARLLFRTFPPYLSRKLVERALLDPEVPKRVPLVEMETLSESSTRRREEAKLPDFV